MTAATVTDTMPPQIEADSWVVESETGGAKVSDPTGGTSDINQTVNLPAGSEILYSVVADIYPFPIGTTVSNTATVTPPGGVVDPNPSNNSSTDTDTINPT